MNQLAWRKSQIGWQQQFWALLMGAWALAIVTAVDANRANAQGTSRDSGPLRWNTVSDTKIPSKNGKQSSDDSGPVSPPTKAPTSSKPLLPVGASRSEGRFVVPTAEIKRTPLRYVGRLYNERDRRSLWGTGTIIRGKKMITARHLMERLNERAERFGDLLLELPSGERFTITGMAATGRRDLNMIAQDLAVASIAAHEPTSEPMLLGGADWQEFDNDMIGSRVYLTGYDMDVMPDDRFELIGRRGSTLPSTLYEKMFRKVGVKIGEGIAEVGKDFRDLRTRELDLLPDDKRKDPNNFFDLGLNSMQSAVLQSLVGGFAAQQAYAWDDCVWLSGDMVCAPGTNGAPLWLEANGKLVVIGVQSLPTGILDFDSSVGGSRGQTVCGGTRIYVSSRADSKDSAANFINHSP
jgi:hypothetical protein